MPDVSQSPAVRSIRKEQAEQRESARRGELDTGLEDTFPASDPVSATHTVVAGSRGDGAVDGEPLVDAALRSARNRDDEGEAVSASEEIKALQREVGRIRESLGELAAGSVRVVRSETREYVRDIEDRIRERPLAAVAIAATVGFVFGARR